jgi:hypothetical protein
MNMSRRKEEDGSVENGGWPDETPQGEGAADAGATAENSGLPDGTPQGEGAAAFNEAVAKAAIKAAAEKAPKAAVPPVFLAIEEHAKALQIPAPVFAAVRQMKGWAAGKKIEEAEFKEAVTTFLGAPIGGKK